MDQVFSLLAVIMKTILVVYLFQDIPLSLLLLLIIKYLTKMYYLKRNVFLLPSIKMYKYFSRSNRTSLFKNILSIDTALLIVPLFNFYPQVRRGRLKKKREKKL